MADYKQELPMDDPKAVKSLLEIIREIIRSEIKSNAQFNRMLPCKIISADNTAKTATIEFLNDGIQIPNVKNRTNLSLATNDLCYCLLINGSSSNLVIMIKY